MAGLQGSHESCFLNYASVLLGLSNRPSFSGLWERNHFYSTISWTIGAVTSMSISQLLFSQSSSALSTFLNSKELIWIKEINQTNENYLIKIVATLVSHQSNNIQNSIKKTKYPQVVTLVTDQNHDNVDRCFRFGIVILLSHWNNNTNVRRFENWQFRESWEIRELRFFLKFLGTWTHRCHRWCDHRLVYLLFLCNNQVERHMSVKQRSIMIYALDTARWLLHGCFEFPFVWMVDLDYCCQKMRCH